MVSVFIGWENRDADTGRTQGDGGGRDYTAVTPRTAAISPSGGTPATDPPPQSAEAANFLTPRFQASRLQKVTE